jgi:hypothetical protein
MKLHEFTEQFQTEEDCRNHFKKVREQQGIRCKKCGSFHHYWLAPKWQWQCKKCRFRTTLRSGTVMQHAHLSFKKWYLAMAIMSSTKKGVSAKELQRQLSHTRYRTIWVLMQKIRFGMGNHVYDEFLEQFYLNQETNPSLRPKKRPDQKSQSVKSNTRVEFARFNVVKNDFTLVNTAIPGLKMKDSSILLTRSQRGRNNLRNCITSTIKVRINSEIRESSAKWTNIIRSNFEDTLIGTYHGVSLVYLKNYMDEFCYRLNWRQLGDGRFDHLILTVARRGLWYG